MIWLCRIEFGVVALGLCVLIIRVIVREAGVLLRESLAEDWLLLTGSLATAGRLVMIPWLGDMETGWILVFAATCVMYLAVKGFRQLV